LGSTARRRRNNGGVGGGGRDRLGLAREGRRTALTSGAGLAATAGGKEARRSDATGWADATWAWLGHTRRRRRGTAAGPLEEKQVGSAGEGGSGPARWSRKRELLGLGCREKGERKAKRAKSQGRKLSLLILFFFYFKTIFKTFQKNLNSF